VGTLIDLSSRRAPPAGVRRAPAREEGDLLFVGISLWLASVARVGYAFASREIFGAEATMALGCVLGIPWLAWRSHRSSRPRGAGSTSRGTPRR